MGEDPFEKILKYIEEQRKMPHVATNIALKELTWPPKSKKADSPPTNISETFPSTDQEPSDDDSAEGGDQEPSDGDEKESQSKSKFNDEDEDEDE